MICQLSYMWLPCTERIYYRRPNATKTVLDISAEMTIWYEIRLIRKKTEAVCCRLARSVLRMRKGWSVGRPAGMGVYSTKCTWGRIFNFQFVASPFARKDQLSGCWMLEKLVFLGGIFTHAAERWDQVNKTAGQTSAHWCIFYQMCMGGEFEDFFSFFCSPGCQEG